MFNNNNIYIYNNDNKPDLADDERFRFQHSKRKADNMQGNLRRARSDEIKLTVQNPQVVSDLRRAEKMAMDRRRQV